MAEIRIEHRYLETLPFLHEHGADALVVLHDLIAHTQRCGHELVVQTSVREIAGRLSFLSKDTVHRRLRHLRHAQVIRTATTTMTSPFDRPTYVVELTGTGISVATNQPRTRPDIDAPSTS